VGKPPLAGPDPLGPARRRAGNARPIVNGLPLTPVRDICSLGDEMAGLGHLDADSCPEESIEGKWS